MDVIDTTYVRKNSNKYERSKNRILDEFVGLIWASAS